VIWFLKGRTPKLIAKIKKEMKEAAKMQDYERAAVLRDKVFALEKTLEKQVAITTDFKDRDVVGIARSDGFLHIVLLVIRGGFLLGRRNFTFPETLSTNSEIIGTFIRQFYEKSSFVPKEILIPDYLEDISFIVDFLADVKGKKVNIIHPKRGEKLRLVQMACHNAETGLEELKASVAAEKDVLVRLQKCLKMENIPRRIECFDVSSISGTAAVAGMVVFEDGKPKKSWYRKYKLKTTVSQDDYAYMNEVLKRRYGKDDTSNVFPDVMMVDGGKGQLNIAVSVINGLNLDHKFQIISIAKKNENRGETRDKIYKPGQANPVNLGRDEDVLLFLERIRNESHRFAISFHRKHRGKAFMRSALDSIPGVGKQRKATLLRHFKSIKKIRAATVEELIRLPGLNRKVAVEIKRLLN
jgi:excinuclease ABC subunit C